MIVFSVSFYPHFLCFCMDGEKDWEKRIKENHCGKWRFFAGIDGELFLWLA